jgi:hypothetical protein
VRCEGEARKYWLRVELYVEQVVMRAEQTIRAYLFFLFSTSAENFYININLLPSKF